MAVMRLAGGTECGGRSTFWTPAVPPPIRRCEPGEPAQIHPPVVAGSDEGTVRYTAAEDTAAIGRLLHEFNREFGEPAPPPRWLAARVGQLLQHGDTVVLLAGNGPDGFGGLSSVGEPSTIG